LYNRNQNRNLGVDIDNVIALTYPIVRRLIDDELSVGEKQKNSFCRNYPKRAITSAQEKTIFQKFNTSFCEKLAVLPHAIDSLKRLKDQYRIILVTSRDLSAQGKTENWLKANRIACDELLFSKAKHAVPIPFDYFIEDNAEFALSLSLGGVKVILFDYEWNRNVQNHNITRVNGWQEAIKILL
jgi:uncharacterized HAD superfamily protein